jgi:hypothetical protein
MKGLDKFMGVGTTHFEHEKLCIVLEGPQLLVQILFFVEWNLHANPCTDVEYILHIAEKQANFT